VAIYYWILSVCGVFYDMYREKLSIAFYLIGLMPAGSKGDIVAENVKDGESPHHVDRPGLQANQLMA
jgi:hypothetical protein